MKTRRIILVGLLAAVLIAGIFVVRFLPANRTAASGGERADESGGQVGAALPVYVQEIRPRMLEDRVSATGSVLADESIDLVSELSGIAVAVPFEEGSRVKRGDLLLKIDDTELRAELARAESRVKLARIQADRQEALMKGGGTTRDNLDTALSELQVLEAEAALARAELAKTEIRAPFDGIVGLRHVSPGAYVTPSTRIATLQKIDAIKIEFALAERHLDRVDEGAEVMISVAGLAEPFTATVYAIEPRIDEETRTLRLRARAPNPGGKALPGGFATVEFPLRQIPDALLVPAAAIIPGLNEQQVYVLEDGRAQPRTVQTGLRLARDVQIVSGLEPGAVVITSGQMQLKPGIPVRPVEPAPRAGMETSRVGAQSPTIAAAGDPAP